MIKPRMKIIRIVFILICVIFCLNSPLFAITYSPGSGDYYKPKCDLLTCTIQYYPEPYDRTTIGIGEEVELNIGNYSDIDIADDGYNQWDIYDNYIGEIQWHLYGDGEISGDTGTGIHYYAPLRSSDTTVTITATVHDSGQYGNDAPIIKSINFDIKIPCGIAEYWLCDVPLGIYGPPYNWIGGESDFQCIILPDTVNFYNVSFRENVPYQEFPWPKKPNLYIPGRAPDGKVYYGVQDAYVYNLGIVSPNVASDHITAQLAQIGYLDDGNGYQDCDFDVVVPNEFYDENGNWNWFFTEHHIRHFYGDDQSCQIEDDGTNSDEGLSMGPYQ